MSTDPGNDAGVRLLASDLGGCAGDTGWLAPRSHAPAAEVDREHTLLFFPLLFRRRGRNIHDFAGITRQVDLSVPSSTWSFIQGKEIPTASVLEPQTVGGSQADECENK